MQTGFSSVFPAPRREAADGVLTAETATDMERLALALLNCAERFEVEAGLSLHVTPPLSAYALGGLAGLGQYAVALLLDYLLGAGIVAWRRQRLLLREPEILYRLALGADPA